MSPFRRRGTRPAPGSRGDRPADRAGGPPGGTPGEEPRTQRLSRMRLIVIQALVLSLFATLLARLYYLQVVEGDAYQEQAASQSVRDIVTQPTRGLIVDDQGRTLVANRLAWVVEVDRTLLGNLSEADQDVVLDRVAEVTGVARRRIDRELVDCGTDGAVSGLCWNGSPYQAVPVAEDVGQRVALAISEVSEDYPSVVLEQQSVRSYPSPFGVNLAHVLGYTSSVTSDELEEAEKDNDTSVDADSVLGRAGLEKEYDTWLRGLPGTSSVTVDSQGNVLGDSDDEEARPGDTLVTSIDAKVQSVVEKQLASTIRTARRTYDSVTKKNYVADSGAVVVMEADTGRIVAMASQPTYDPEVWAGGITEKQLRRLYSEKAGTPLLSRATQGQFAPGSTWKPFMTVGALTHGYSTSTQLNCSNSVTIGNRTFKNYESEAYGLIGFQRALEVSCNTFFYRIGYHYWLKYGSDETDVNAKDPLVAEAKKFGFGQATGVDLPGEASGRVADRRWKRSYWKSMKSYYCGIARKPQTAKTSDFLYQFAQEFCADGYAYRAGDAANFAIGQGDTLVTPLQLARAYAALANGGTLYAPRVGKAVVGSDGTVIKRIKPSVVGHVSMPKKVLSYLDTALSGVTSEGTMAWKMQGFPLSKVDIRSKTGSAEVYGKQSTSWVASYSDDYVVVMMVSQGGTGSGTSGPAVRKIWESLYGVDGESVDTDDSAIPGVVQSEGLPVFTDDGSILPPRTTGASAGKSTTKAKAKAASGTAKGSGA
ncbi:penicillin-binding protein 2 [Nocardioides sp. GY 10127]|uniref:penicillin-binding protein 2 n=1 Tax=Nocardioides sp. GY 10127 TaxID=2569762 RepID=UPI0010A91FAB|nr:penicillin-binding protein 2 [Nocardioides sp. GY 10127]TIC80748.1 penicillin-binding protein 2 [Nocardioides sp. GY 10127]